MGPEADSGIGTYNELTRLIERLHRRYLDVLRTELERLEIDDINAVQCLLLCNIGVDEVNVRNLMDRGYYLGSNASYNIKKLVESGYLEQARSPRDRRSTLLRLSPKGLTLTDQVAKLQERHARRLAEQDGDGDSEAAVRVLRRLERDWEEYVVLRT